MNTDPTFATFVDSCGAGRFALAAWQWPSGWRAAKAGHVVPAGRLVAISAMSLMVIVMFTWPSAPLPGKSSASAALDSFRPHDMVIRIGVLTALAALLAVLMLTLAVGIRFRRTERVEEYTA
jgi:hypothetical protein